MSTNPGSKARRTRGFTAPGDYLRTGMVRQSTAAFMGVEKKYVDVHRTDVNIVSVVAGSEQDPATPLCLNGIDIGNTVNTRIGNKVMMKSIQIKGMIDANNYSDFPDALPSVLVKVALVWDKQTNGAQLNAEDVYQVSGGLPVLSMRDIEFSERFTVLKEWMLEVDWTNSQTDGTNTASVAGQKVYFDCYKTLNIPVKYKATGGTVSSIMDNSLHMIAFCAHENVGQTKLSYTSRIRYVG